MGLSYVPAISAGLLLPTGILQQIGQQLGDTENIIWIPGGWSVASAVAFSTAGALSDIFGRRWVLMSGQVMTLVGGIVGATATSTLHVAAGSTIIGFGAGVIFVGYPGKLIVLSLGRFSSSPEPLQVKKKCISSKITRDLVLCCFNLLRQFKGRTGSSIRSIHTIIFLFGQNLT